MMVVRYCLPNDINPSNICSCLPQASLNHQYILCFKLNALQFDEHTWNSTSFLLGGQPDEQCDAGGRRRSTISNKAITNKRLSHVDH